MRECAAEREWGLTKSKLVLMGWRRSAEGKGWPSELECLDLFGKPGAYDLESRGGEGKPWVWAVWRCEPALRGSCILPFGTLELT